MQDSLNCLEVHEDVLQNRDNCLTDQYKNCQVLPIPVTHHRYPQTHQEICKMPYPENPPYQYPEVPRKPHQLYTDSLILLWIHMYMLHVHHSEIHYIVQPLSPMPLLHARNNAILLFLLHHHHLLEQC